MATGMHNMADGTFYEADQALAEKDAEIAHLRAEDSYQKMLLEQAKGTLLNLRAEADALRVDAMRYRFIRDADRCDEHIRYEELLMYAEENLDEAIDAAMGASA